MSPFPTWCGVVARRELAMLGQSWNGLVISGEGLNVAVCQINARLCFCLYLS